MNTKLCINKAIHALLMTRFAAFISRIHQIRSQCNFAVASINERLVLKSYTDSDMVKMEVQAT